MEGAALVLAPDSGGPSLVFRLGGNGSWLCTDAWAYAVQRGSEGDWQIVDEDGVEVGGPLPSLYGEPAPASLAAAGGSLGGSEPEPDKLKEAAGGRHAVHGLILAAARERNAGASAAATEPYRDPSDGELPPRGQWAVDGASYSLSLLEVSAEEDALMSLECQYQSTLRPLQDMLSHLERVVGRFSGLICDLGCGAGAAAGLFANRDGVNAMGIDSDPRMVAAAKARHPRLSFRCADVGRLHVFRELQGAASGVWCSFTAAHFPGKQLEKAILQWAWLLRPGGWLCLLDLEGLFSVHRPFAETRWARDFRQLDDDLQNVAKYDAFVAKRLAQACKRAKLQVLSEREWPGATEFNFDGPASKDQVNAWAARLERDPMRSVFLKYFRDFDKGAKEALLGCLRAEDHSTRCKVRMVICTKPGG